MISLLFSILIFTNQPTVLSLGDSITLNSCDYLKRELFQEVVCSSVGGENIERFAERILSTEIKLPEKSKVAIHIGTNDMGYFPNYEALAEIIFFTAMNLINWNSDLEVYIARIIPSRNEFHDKHIKWFNIFLVERFKEINHPQIHLVDMEKVFRNDEFGFCGGDWKTNCMSDDIHPNENGYKSIARKWANEIKA